VLSDISDKPSSRQSTDKTLHLPYSKDTMVRFKNRYVIVEFLQPSASTPQLDHSQRAIAQAIQEDFSDDEDEEEDGDTLTRIPDIPFLLPPIPGLGRLRDSDDAGKGIYKAVRGMVQDVFGDEGWGRISSSFRGKNAYSSQAQ
jgi:ribonuclease P/MRP protein subunit POP5